LGGDAGRGSGTDGDRGEVPGGVDEEDLAVGALGRQQVIAPDALLLLQASRHAGAVRQLAFRLVARVLTPVLLHPAAESSLIDL
jgi:hypothetical protein